MFFGLCSFFAKQEGKREIDMSDEDKKRKLESARRAREEAELQVRRLEEEARLEASKLKTTKPGSETVHSEEQAQLKKWEKSRKSLSRTPPRGSGKQPRGVVPASSASSVGGTDTEGEDPTKKIPLLSPVIVPTQKRTKTDDEEEGIEGADDPDEDCLTAILSMTKRPTGLGHSSKRVRA